MVADNNPDDASEPIDYDEYARETCTHEFVSWHGSRGECQECGQAISPA